MISVVVPAHNEETFIPRCLSALKNQKCSEPFEIIVVDNNSTDKTAEVARQFGAIVLHETKQGVGAARRAGVAAAQGDIIVTVDADTALLPGYLENAVRKLRTHPNIACLGGMFHFYDAPPWKSALRKMVARPLYWFFYVAGRSRVGTMGNNMCFRKEDYKKTHGFNDNLRFGEDIDLNKQLSRIGRIVVDFSLPVETSSRRFRFDKSLAAYAWNSTYHAVTGKPFKNDLPDLDTQKK